MWTGIFLLGVVVATTCYFAYLVRYILWLYPAERDAIRVEAEAYEQAQKELEILKPKDDLFHSRLEGPLG
jgi:hypothetical protein